MNIMNRVTWQTMKKNRVRTIVTIIGIILSTAMFTAVFALCTSFYNFAKEAEIVDSGSYHLKAMHLSGSSLKSAESDPRTEYTAYARILGYSRFDSLNVDKPYICVLAADDTFFANMPVKLVEGRLPENDSELVLPAHLSSNGGATHYVGEELTLELGERVIVDSENTEYVLYQENPYSYESEQLRGETAKTYTVVGICKRPDFESYSAPGYTALTKLTGEKEADTIYECYIRVKNPRANFYKYVEEHGELAEFGYEEHSGLLMMEGATRYDNLSNVLTGFAAILSVLVFIGSVALIYSAFSISVSERTKQFGLLSSVGATRKQVRRSVLCEALSLSAIGIPLGVFAGIGGIALTLFLLRGKFSGILNSSEVAMRIHVTWPGILAAVLVALVTVLVSAWIPSIRAMRITPMEAIRQTRDVSSKGGKSKRYPKLFAKLFGAEGMLAQKYYTRSSKKYRATIISLAMSVILFVAASAFCASAAKSVNAVDNRPNFDGYFSWLPKDRFDRLRSSLAENASEFAGYVVCGTEEGFYVNIPESDRTEEYAAYLKEGFENSESLYCGIGVTRSYMDDVSFRELLEKNGISGEGFFNAEAPEALVLNNTAVTRYSRQDDDSYTRKTYVFNFLKPGVKSISVAPSPAAPEGYTGQHTGVYWTGDSWGEGEMSLYCLPNSGGSSFDGVEFDCFGRPIGQPVVPLEFTELPIGGMIEDAPVGISRSQDVVVLLYPMSVYRGSSEAAEFFFRSDDTQESIKAMTSVLEDAGVTVNNESFYDVTEEGRLLKNVITIIKVFSYGFITLISLISVANVFNTVTTNVALRRRDYAMLRSMGMTNRGMNRMSNFECLIYGTRSLLIGLPIAIALSYLIHRVASDAAVTRFELPWTAIAIAVVSVFVVVFVSMLYSTGKLKKDNPIDALKDENI